MSGLTEEVMSKTFNKYLRPSTEQQVLFFLEKLFAEREAIPEKRFYRHFAKARQTEAMGIVSKLLSNGFIHRIGTGSKRAPYRLIPSLTWQRNRCPVCQGVTDASRELVAYFDERYKRSKEYSERTTGGAQ